MSLRSTQLNGGPNGHATGQPLSKRFSDIPSAIEVPVGDQEDEAVEIGLEDLVDDPTELCTLLENEGAARTYWMTVALAYAKHRKIDHAIELLIRGGNAMQSNNPKEKLALVSCLCWMYLWKSRQAPRIAPKGTLVSEAKTKDYYLGMATSALNEASKIHPAFPPLFLARGVLYLLRASLQPPSKTAPVAGKDVDPEKAELLRLAGKSFDDAIRVSQGKNMLAVMGKSRVLFSQGHYAEALAGYQDVLMKMPDLYDPDPRIGIGCCFWQLGYKDDAKAAWERSLEINPDSKIANILLGLYYLDASGHVPVNSPEFVRLYKKAMTEYTQKSFKLDKDLPLTCATFAGYFMSTKKLPTVETLAQKAIELTDVNAIASDGWYLLARKEHYSGNVDNALDYYRRADDARGGTERGYLPAKFGAAQLSVLKNDLGEAKLRLEKMIQQSKNHEAMILLGILYAEEVFANQYAVVKEDKSAEASKAISLLEAARTAWKDPKKGLSPDACVLLNLARLYETSNPDKALQCLQQVEQFEIDQIPQSEYPENEEDEVVIRNHLRRLLPPQLLNNIGCFHYQAEKYDQASEMFEAALSSCMRIGEQGDKSDETDTDALVTTISFNLGRSYEARGLLDQALEVYEGLLRRHDDYTDARTRVAYIKLRTSPNKEGPDAVAKLYETNGADLEVRALYGYLLNKIGARKRPANISEDPEQRLYKHTLQNYDKHDRYALVGMGNLYLTAAREMRRETEQERQKRSAVYQKAVEFFDKALQLDPKNAYAAQGIAIALVEDKKDLKNALQIFVKVRDTIKDYHVYVNLGHIYAELKQYSKAIENYEIALSKEGRANDSSILACLGKTWLSKGRSERDLDAYKMALQCAKKALESSPDQIFYKFNVAFVQIQLAMTIYGLSETQRTVAQLEDAAAGLESAIEALDEIAAHPQPPYPKHDIEQRASMARNTQRKQLERAIASQKQYEEKNREKLAAALEKRNAELRRREEEKQRALEQERERQEKIRREREEIMKRDRELAERRAEEERARAAAEMTTDSETGEKVKRKRKAPTRTAGEGGAKPKSRSKKKKAEGEDGLEESDGERHTKKRRRLTTKKQNQKYKSEEIVYDSDDSGGGGGEDALDRADRELARDTRTPESDASGSTPPPTRRRKAERSSRRNLSDDEDDEGGDKMDVDEASPARNNDRADSDEDQDDDDAPRTRRAQPARSRRGGRVLDESDEEEEEENERAGGGDQDDDDDEEAAPASRSRRSRRVDTDDENEDSDAANGKNGSSPAAASSDSDAEVSSSRKGGRRSGVDTSMADDDDDE